MHNRLLRHISHLDIILHFGERFVEFAASVVNPLYACHISRLNGTSSMKNFQIPYLQDIESSLIIITTITNSLLRLRIEDREVKNSFKTFNAPVDSS